MEGHSDIMYKLGDGEGEIATKLYLVAVTLDFPSHFARITR